MIYIIINILKYLLLMIICIIVFRTSYSLVSRTKTLGEKTTKSIDRKYKASGEMNQFRLKMSKLGVMYSLQNYELTPSWYIMMRLAIGMISGLVLYALLKNASLSLIMVPIGYIAVELYYRRQNAVNNKNMMMDIYQTYASLNIQSSANIYMVNSIQYIYKIVKNKRYKEALEELIINFSDKTVSMSDSINIFKNRFSSREIDKLCALMNNIMQYGISESYTKDIMGEINSIILSTTLEVEHDIDNKVELITFLFFTVIIFIVVYIVYKSFAGINLF